MGKVISKVFSFLAPKPPPPMAPPPPPPPPEPVAPPVVENASPAAPPQTAAETAPPREDDPRVVKAKQSARAASGATMGRNSTVLTSVLGLSGAASTAKKTLLGN